MKLGGGVSTVGGGGFECDDVIIDHRDLPLKFRGGGFQMMTNDDERGGGG